MGSERVWTVPEPSCVLEVQVGEDAVIIARRYGNPDGTRLILCHGNGLAIDVYLPFWSLLMAAIFATPERVAAAVDELNASTGGSPVSVAADNGMHQVISGPADAVDSLLKRFEADKAWVRRLRKSPAYHSALVAPALDGLEALVDGIETAMPSVT